MLRIDCPHCGPRDEAEFTYRGDATVVRPGPDAGIEAWDDYLHLRDNPRGWTVEWWLHSAGCRAVLKVRRHTVTHQVDAVAVAGGRPGTDRA
ncbi:MAG: sarcosine oxidase subunit delta [Alphaproteobacteria bacterium]|nr:sarcosine oxidase subunit delta [Alphaproteobacteria bacterium]MBM3629031.1 sarcosine oxidase subunit delta [Alphaproteobacteria bacterium]